MLGNAEECSAQFNFMAAHIRSSLYRNARVMMRRNADGDTESSTGIDLENHLMTVHNARLLDDSQWMSCEINGFELRTCPLSNGPIDFLDHAQVTGEYYQQCASLVEQCTGARAYAFDHNIRSASGQSDQQRIKGGQRVQGPAHLVHGDYTLRAAPERLAQLAQPPVGNDTLVGVLPEGQSLIQPDDVTRSMAPGGRFAIINVWRNIDDAPVATHPMALCDGRSVEAQDLVVFEIHYPNRVGENYFARFSEKQQMYYYPNMMPDEVLLIKQWDSAGPLARSAGKVADGAVEGAPCSFSFHSAFQDPGTPADAPDRWSIEVRCVVIYDDAPSQAAGQTTVPFA